METGIRTLTATDLAEVTTTQNDTLGAVGQTADGRKFRYVQAGGAVVAGNVLVAPGTTAGHLNLAIPAAAAAGASQLDVTLGAAAATLDQYRGGYLVIGVDGSGVPVTRKIRGNTAGAATGRITVYLEAKEPLLFALTTSNVASLIPNPFSSVTASSTAGSPVGVALTSIASGSYGWAQTFGPIAVVADAAVGGLAALVKIKQSGTVAGAVVSGAAAGDLSIGYMLQAVAVSKAGLAHLDIG